MNANDELLEEYNLLKLAIVMQSTKLESLSFCY